MWAAIGGTGSAVGVVLGGALTGGPGWEWVFYINVPVGVLALAALPALLPRRSPQPARLDLPGAVLVTAGTGCLIYGLVKAGDAGWGMPPLYRHCLAPSSCTEPLPPSSAPAGLH